MRLINKTKLESAVVTKVMEEILTPTNIRNYIRRVMESARNSERQALAGVRGGPNGAD